MTGQRPPPTFAGERKASVNGPSRREAIIPKLDGKVAIISGGASGIGAATARLLVASGAKVALGDIDGAKGEALARDLGGRVCRFQTLDVTKEADWDRIFAETASAFGPPSILVNCAGISIPAPIEDTSLDLLRKTLAVNVEGTFLGCRAAVRAMRQTGGGAIVNIASTMGARGGASLAAYCTSKGAVRQLTKSVALRCAEAKYNIRCNAVLPGAIETPMIEPFISAGGDRAAGLQAFASVHPIGRCGKPEEIAAAIAFLASDEASYMTGADVPVDGGFLA